VAAKVALVTGASGFLGRHIVLALFQRGYEVHGCSHAGMAPSGSLRRHRIDLLDPGAVATMVSTVRASHLIMAAWTTRPGVYQTDPRNDDWVRETETLARNFCTQDGKRMVFVGSSAEYDWRDPAVAKPISETDAGGTPVSLYGQAKRRAAAALAMLAADRDVSFAEARLFFPIGPGENPARFVPSIVRSILAGEAAQLDPGDQVRDLIDVRDAAAAIVTLLDGNVTGTVNIGTGAPSRLGDVAKNIGTIMGRPDLIRLGELEPQPEEPVTLVANVAKLNDEVGFKPRYALAETLRASISFWKSRPDLAGPSAANARTPR
jgi:nucleoside-diphosphate-sugar epimerase